MRAAPDLLTEQSSGFAARLCGLAASQPDLKGFPMTVTTTHDPRGGGHPRLIFAVGDYAPANTEQREFMLRPGVTVIGSASDADLRLAGLAAHHAEIRRDATDEYVYVDLGTSAGSRVDGRPAVENALHTGDRIELGTWTLSYFREEFADHGRPYGGRAGGELSRQRLQLEPRPRGTSASGGSDRTGADPGEYF
jgi:FHA domain